MSLNKPMQRGWGDAVDNACARDMLYGTAELRVCTLCKPQTHHVVAAPAPTTLGEWMEAHNAIPGKLQMLQVMFRPGICHRSQGTAKPQSHLQNEQWFVSYNWTSQQFWTAALIVPDTSRWCQTGWMQCDVLSGGPRLCPRSSSMLQKLWERIQEYFEECIVVFKMLQNQTFRICKFRS